MTSRQRDLVLWLGRVGHCGRRGIVNGGWHARTLEAAVAAGWVEIDPDHPYSYRATRLGIRAAVLQ